MGVGHQGLPAIVGFLGYLSMRPGGRKEIGRMSDSRKLTG